MARWKRDYYVLKTLVGEAIGVVQLPSPTMGSSSIEFCLIRPERKGTIHEFVDLAESEIEQTEFETHRDAFETLTELDVVEVRYTSTNLTTNVLVRKKNVPDRVQETGG